MSGETPETLWNRAHDQVRRGDFASAVRDLAQCFQLLQAAGDPRVYEVHKRWTEVHKLYMEDGQRQVVAKEPEKAPSIEAEAEAAANAGDLDKAIALYRDAVQQSPDNELIQERLLELTQARARADDLATGKANVTAASVAAANAAADAAVADVAFDVAVDVSTDVSTDGAVEVGVSDFAAGDVVGMADVNDLVAAANAANAANAIEVGNAESAMEVVRVENVVTSAATTFEFQTAGEALQDAQAAAQALSSTVPASSGGEDDWSDVAMDTESSPIGTQRPSVDVPVATAPTMAVEDAPVGMQSLDVAFSVGPPIDADVADELPVEGKASVPPMTTRPASASPTDDVAFLEALLVRVQANGRRA